MQEPDGILEIKRDWCGRIVKVTYKSIASNVRDMKHDEHRAIIAGDTIQSVFPYEIKD